MRRLLGLCAVLLLVALLFASPLAAQTTGIHLDPEVRAALEQGSTLDVLVTFSESPPRGVATALEPRKEALKAQIVRISPLPLDEPTRFARLPLLHLYPTVEQLRALAQHPDVEGLYANRHRTLFLESSLPFLGAPVRHGQGFGGDGTAVAILDTGIQYWNGHFGDCPEAGAPGCSVGAFVNFTDQDDVTTATYSPHGSNVGGIVLGVAPETTLLSLNVFRYSDFAGQYVAEDHAILKALDWVAENKETYNIVAVNMSLGSDREESPPCNGTPFEKAITTLYEDHDILCAIASGNEAVEDALGEPSCVTNAVSVGAHFDTDTTWVISRNCSHLYGVAGEMVCFSNRNGALDLVAPGVYVTAGGFEDYSGTSMAAPHVAGAIALMQDIWSREAQAPLSAAEVHRRLLVDASPLPQDGWVFMRATLDPESSPRWGQMLMFPAYNREVVEAAIPEAPRALTFTLLPPPVPGSTFLRGAPYLHLEVSHPSPEEVEATLTAPNGESVSVQLPGGKTNFNGVLGRTVAPGVFAPLTRAGGGVWTLELRDTVPGQGGYYLSAALFWPEAACVPACGTRTCGDDGCGGVCGSCPDTERCGAEGDCLTKDETCRGDSCARPWAVPARPGVYLGSTAACSYGSSARCGGGNAPDRVYSFTLKEGSPFAARLVADFEAILYLRRGTCPRGAELACEAVDEDGVAAIRDDLGPGTYYLFVDGTDFNRTLGTYRLELDLCEADCTGRACGSDGCGGSCGDCGEGEACLEETGLCCAPSCEDGAVCVSDGCEGICDCPEGPCDPETEPARCWSGQVIACDPEGNWVPERRCEEGETCEDGACVADEPEDGDRDEEEGDDADGDADNAEDDADDARPKSGGCSGTPGASFWLLGLFLALLRLRAYYARPSLG